MTRTKRKNEPALPLTDSVAELRHLFSSLSSFFSRYDDLQSHLQFIETTLHSNLPNHLIDITPPQPQPQPQTQTKPLNKDEEGSDSDSDSDSDSELDKVCKNMSFRGLRRYITSHILGIDKLREEAPKALKKAPNPAKLVIQCLGRFFLGQKAKDCNKPSMFALEIFMLMGCDGVQIEPAVKEEADAFSSMWMKRLLLEGGLGKVGEIDARGLLLLIGCYGIPPVFTNEDIRDLILHSNAWEISDALCRSTVLSARIPEIIEGMVKNNMEIEAVCIAYTFGVESLHDPILKSFLHNSEETWKKAREEAQGSLLAVNEVNKKRLADLNSVIKCLEHHKIDPSNLLHELQSNKMMLENEISDLNSKIETASSKNGLKVQEGQKVQQETQANVTESSNKWKTREKEISDLDKKEGEKVKVKSMRKVDETVSSNNLIKAPGKERVQGEKKANETESSNKLKTLSSNNWLKAQEKEKVQQERKASETESSNECKTQEKEISDLDKKSGEKVKPTRRVDETVSSNNWIKAQEKERVRQEREADETVSSNNLLKAQGGEISDLDKKLGDKVKSKRKVNETVSSNKLKTQELKRSRYADHVPRQQSEAAYADVEKSNQGLTQMNFVNGGFPGHINPYAGLIAGSGFGSGVSAAHGSGQPTGSYSGFSGGVALGTVRPMADYNSQLYGRPRDTGVNERLTGRAFAGSLLTGGYSSYYRSSPSLEGFAGLPDHPSVGVSGRNSGSDLYQFADAVVENELHRSDGGRAGGTVPRASARHSPFI